MSTTVDDVLWMLDVIAEVGATPVIGGGWGVDALVGSQTRDHRDLDVLIPEPAVAEVVETLVAASFVVTTDWLPVRIELSDLVADRHIDVHPALDDGAGGWWQHGFDGQRFETPAEVITDGIIGGRPVRCLTVARHLELHRDYEPVGHDVDVLRTLAASSWNARGGRSDR